MWRSKNCILTIIYSVLICSPSQHPVEQIRCLSGFQTLSVDPHFQSHFPCNPELLMGTTVQDCLIFPGCRVNQQQIESFTWPPWQRWISGKIGSMKKAIPTSDIQILSSLSLWNISFRCFISQIILAILPLSGWWKRLLMASGEAALCLITPPSLWGSFSLDLIWEMEHNVEHLKKKNCNYMPVPILAYCHPLTYETYW